MDTRTSALPASCDAAPPELKPVAVTRWSARLTDPACERAFLEGRFPDDRRRVLVLLGFIAASGVFRSAGPGTCR